MKKAFFTLTAILAAGIASAITFDWSSSTTVLTTSGSTAGSASLSESYQSAVDVNVGTTNYYGAIVSGSLPGGTNIRAIFGVSDGSNQSLTVSTTGTSGAISIYQNGSGATDTGSTTGTLVATSSTTISSYSSYYLVLEVTRASTGETYVALYGSTDGTNYTTLIESTLASGIASTSTLDTVYAVDYNGVNGGARWGNASSVVVYANDTVLLPEPTVLALLALGVAGIALRRKNA